MEKIEERPGKVSFKQAWKDFFIGFFDFRGRSTGVGFASVQIICFFIAIIIGNFVSKEIMGVVFRNSGAMSQGEYGLMILSFFLYVLLALSLTLGLTVPALALTVRRLRDIGFKWQGQIIIFVISTIFNNVITLVAGKNIAVPINETSFIHLSEMISAIEIIVLSILPTGILATSRESGITAFLFNNKCFYKEDL